MYRVAIGTISHQSKPIFQQPVRHREIPLHRGDIGSTFAGFTVSVGNTFLKVRISSPEITNEQARYTHAPTKDPVVCLIQPVI